MLVDLLTRRYPGMRLWLTQRLTAIIMVLYIGMMLLLLLVKNPSGYVAWHAFMSPPWLRVATFLFFICLVMHAWLGIRDVMRDYVRNISLRDYMQLSLEILLAIYLIWLAWILWKI